MAPMQWRDATVSGMVDPRAERQEPDVSQVIGQFGQASYPGSSFEGLGFDGRGGLVDVDVDVDQFGSTMALPAVPVGLDLPCTEDPELFFAESPSDVEQAKAMCLGCRARLACLAGALERREPWGVWGGELLLRGVVVPRKRPRGRPRKNEQTEPASPAGPAEQPDKADVAA
jgi:WhiB family transcriptional regulator, redox-sensing transcriptional regulator